MYNQPELSEDARLGLHQIKLDLVAGSKYAWRSMHNHMLMRRSVVLDNLAKTVPPIDPDQRVSLLHAPFRGATLFWGELAKVYRANKELASSVTHVPNILPENIVVYGGIPIRGNTQLGRRSHPTWSFTLEATTTTLLLFRSDKPVFTTAAFIPSSPCHPTQAMAGPVQAEFTIFTDTSTQGWSTHMRDSRIAGAWTRSDHKLHIKVLEIRVLILALHHWVTVLQGHHVLIATDNTTVVAYINTFRAA